MEEEEAKVSKMELELGSILKEGANVGRNAEPVRDQEVAESKGGAGDRTQKQLSRKSQQEEATKPEHGEKIAEHKKNARVAPL